MHMTDLPGRVIVDQHGHYWRDYGDFLSMPPVSDENVATEVAAIYIADPEDGTVRAALKRMVEEIYEAHHTPSSESGPEEWDYTLDVPSIEAVQQAIRALAGPGAAP